MIPKIFFFKKAIWVCEFQRKSVSLSLCAKVLRLILFVGELFSLFSTDLNLALNFAFYGTHIEFNKKKFISTFFANFRAKIGRNGT
jgi:hypothetical protein